MFITEDIIIHEKRYNYWLWATKPIRLTKLHLMVNACMNEMKHALYMKTETKNLQFQNISKLEKTLMIKVVFYGQEPPREFHYHCVWGQLSHTCRNATEEAQWATRSSSSWTQPAKDNGIRIGRSIWLPITPNLYRVVLLSECLLHHKCICSLKDHTSDHHIATQSQAIIVTLFICIRLY